MKVLLSYLRSLDRELLLYFSGLPYDIILKEYYTGGVEVFRLDQHLTSTLGPWPSSSDIFFKL